MTSYVPRTAWTDHPAPDGLTPLPATVRGVAVHWTGGAGYGPHATLEQSCARLEGFRRFHTDPVPKGRGWSDFAYNVAFDVEGRVFDGRGLRRMSAANGNRQVNSSHAAVLFLLGKGDIPTEAMLAAFADWRATRWLPAWPAAVEVVGHRDLHGTDCPGPVLYPLVRSGRLAQPVPTPAHSTVEDPMARLDPDDLAAIADELLSSQPGAAGARYKVKDGVDPATGDPVLLGLTDAGTRMLALLRAVQAEQARQAGVLAALGEAVAALGARS